MNSMRSNRMALLGLALTAACAGAGCRDAEAQERIVLGPSDLPTSAGLGEGGTWQSVGWSGDPWPAFPGPSEVVISHGLGTEPRSVLVYISFEDSGASAALASGDLALFRQVTDTEVTLANRTNQDFFFRLVIE